jgi:GH18 family chitinase
LSKGVRPELLNLGIPTYGRFYKLEDPNQNEPGSASAGQKRGNSSNESGFRAYYEVKKAKY